MTDTIRSPRQVLTGAGGADHIGGLCAEYGRRVLVVTDTVVSTQHEVRDVLTDVRERVDTVHVYDAAIPEVPVSDVADAVAAARTGAVDSILAIGGGTVIDLAKMVGVLYRYGGHARDYYGECRVPGPLPPLVAVPTTAGTGSEVSPVAVLSDPERTLKVGVSSTHLVPDVAVVDPRLTYSCPPGVTAYSGVDALCHAVESFTAPVIGDTDPVGAVFAGRNDVTDDAAVRAVRAIAPHLVRAVRDGEDHEAREQMARGASWAGLAFAHAGTACPHALQYPIGAATGTSHGLGVGLLLPYALTAVRETAADRMAELAGCVGLDVDTTRPRVAAESFIEWLCELLDAVGVPRRLADIGIEVTDIPDLAERAAGVTRLLRNHPGPTEVADLRRILEAAHSGDREQVGSRSA